MKKKSATPKSQKPSSAKSYLKQTAFGISAFIIGTASGVGIAQKEDQKPRVNERSAYSAPAKQEYIARNDLPATSYVINRAGYSLAYDPRTRNPIYTYEKLSSSSLVGRVSRDNCQFKEDNRIPEIFRSTLKDYQSSGYDRGHLAPAANHKGSYDAMADTFFMSNMSPQDPKFNRGYWANLEKYVRDLTKECRTLEVFTGPLYLPVEEADGKRYVKYQVIGKNDVAVPTHFFKVS